MCLVFVLLGKYVQLFAQKDIIVLQEVSLHWHAFLAPTRTPLDNLYRHVSHAQEVFIAQSVQQVPLLLAPQAEYAL